MITAATIAIVAAFGLCAFLTWLVKQQADQRCLDLTERLLHVEQSRDTMIAQLGARSGVGTEPTKTHHTYVRTAGGVSYGDGRVTDLDGRPVNVEHIAPKMKDAAPREPADPMYRKLDEDEVWTKGEPTELPQPTGVD